MVCRRAVGTIVRRQKIAQLTDSKTCLYLVSKINLLSMREMILLPTTQHNARRVLRTIYERGTISRADLARATKLTRPTVSTIVANLIELDLVRETGRGQSTGGKRPVLLTMPDNAYYLVCVDLSGPVYRGALVNMRGEVMVRHTLSAENAQGNAAVERLIELIEQLTAHSDRPILGISVGSPGLVDPQTGVVHRAIHLDWQDVPLRQLLAARFAKPIYVANDGHVAALAEFMRERENVILIKAGQGIGAGIVWNGTMLTGDGFGAGEIGQVTMIERDGQPLTLEQLVSQPAILQQARAQISAEITWQQFVTHANATPIIASVARYLGMAIANLIAILNIHHIVIVGPLIEFGEPLRQAIEQMARRYALPTMVDATQIRFSTLGDESVLQGCAALLLKEELGIL